MKTTTFHSAKKCIFATIKFFFTSYIYKTSRVNSTNYPCKFGDVIYLAYNFSCHINVWMFYYSRIDVSEEIDVNKTHESKIANVLFEIIIILLKQILERSQKYAMVIMI